MSGVTETVIVSTITAAITALGLDAQPLFWALIGASIGISFAPKTGALRGVFLFCIVVLACSLLGSWSAETWGTGKPIERSGAACMLAIVFHPLLTAVVAAIPGWIAKRLGTTTGDQR